MNLELKLFYSVISFMAISLFCPSASAMSKIESSTSASHEDTATTDAHNAWLKMRFSEQHKKLIPVVGVADMFFACNQVRKTDSAKHALPDLITKVSRDELALKLSTCLGEDSMNSEVALNFGLQGCFQAQLAHLPAQEREQKMKLVKQAIGKLSREERKKSFTQCVTEQAIHYLK